MCGVPNSGKSTWIQTHEETFENPHFIVSRDVIRFKMLKDGEPYFLHEKKVFKEFIEKIKWGLKNKRVVVADATHINEASRRKLLNSLGGSLANVKVIAVVMRTSLEVALDRNKKRESSSRKYVPPESIKDMYRHFRVPKFNEGFNKIVLSPVDQKPGERYIIRISSNKAVI